MRLQLGPGPVFAYEWLRTSRRWQLYALRSLFVFMVAGGFLVVWWSKLSGRELYLRDLAATGESFFYALVGTQLILILLAAPAYTAGAICVDKARGTLAHLLVTDLCDRELVLGKWLALILPVVGLVACTAPLLFAAILLGGIEPDSAIGATAVTLGVALLAGSLALTFSVWAKKTYEVLLATYLLLAFVILADPMWSVLGGYLPLRLAPAWLAASNPFFLAFCPYLKPGNAWLATQLAFLGACLLLSLSLVVLAIYRIRAVALRHMSYQAHPPRPPRVGNRFRAVWRGLPGPSLDGNPVLWREWRRQRPSRWVRGVWWLYLTVAVIFSGLTLVDSGNRRLIFAPWVNALQIPIGLLLLTIGSVTGLAEERVRATLDVLLSTPLSTLKIIWGKWCGAYRASVPLLPLPFVVVFPMAMRAMRGAYWFGVVLLVIMVLTYSAAVTSLGLVLATWIPRQGRALALAVTMLTLITVVPFLPLLMFTRMTPDSSLEAFASASPFYGPGALTSSLALPQGNELFDQLVWNTS